MMNLTIKMAALSLAMSATVTLKAQNPVQYMDKVNNEFRKISEETWDYTRAVAHNKKSPPDRRAAPPDAECQP